MKSRERLFLYLAAILLILSVLIRIGLTLQRKFNVDEFQHLHAAWMLHQSYVPYRDFWENHTPLLYHLLQPVVSATGESAATLLISRALLSAAGVAILFLVYAIARLDFDRNIAITAVLILSYTDLFLQKTIEVRTDQLLVLCWLTSLWFTARSLHAGRSKSLVFAGMFLGAGMLFSPKALLCLAAILLTVAFFVRRTSVSQCAFQCLHYIAGFLLPLILLAAVYWRYDALGDLIRTTLLENLSYPSNRRATFLLLPHNLAFLALAAAGMILCYAQRTQRTKYCITLMIPSIVLFALFIFVLPSPFPQTTLLFVPLWAIFAAIAVQRCIDARSSGVYAIFVLVAAVMIPAANIAYIRPFAATNKPQLELIEYITTQTKSDETIFDGNAAYIFRKQAYYFGSLVEGVRERIDRGEIQDDIVKSLKNAECRIVIYDDRVSDLPATVQDFLRANYLPIGRHDIYVAGKELHSESISGNRATFLIEIPGVYRIAPTPNTEASLDGRRIEDPLFLKAGKHELFARHHLQRVLIIAEPFAPSPP